MSDYSGGLLFFCVADVVFFFGVPTEPSAFDAVFCPLLFFFIGTDEGGGENGSLEVFAMRDKSSGNEAGGGLSVG
jgi:hypothetical protein